MRLVIFTLALATACGGTAPQVRYYQLASQTPSRPVHGTKVLVVETFGAEGAYDDERIVYRDNPYRLDYYNYHRWSATPGILVSAYLDQALTHTGEFKAVVRESTQDAALVLGGRITAIEEVDRDAAHWVGRIALDLTLTDPKTGAVIWAQPFEDTEPLANRDPEGLARALSIALDRIATRAAPLIIEHASLDAQVEK